VIAIDTNILVYAHREDSTWHEAADRCVSGAAECGLPWAIPWPCIHEFLAIVTHPRIYDPPTPLDHALEQVACWLEIPTLITLSESAQHWRMLRDVLEAGQVSGSQIHDARIAALCRQHGVRELWTADRDFGRFAGLRFRNPLIVAA
jgi:toxin-antitoxin system PIN domain toxin